jgi:hypothetical protein
MLSKLKKKLKSRQPGSKHKLDRTEVDADEERVDPIGSLPQPGPHVVAGGEHSDVGIAMGSGSIQEGYEADGEQVEQVYPSPSTPSLVRGGNLNGMWM